MKDKNSHWTSRPVVEPDSGKRYRKYFYKRRPACRVLVETPKAKVLAGYVLIEKDLRCASIWLGEVVDLLESEPLFHESLGSTVSPSDHKLILAKGFFVAALTFYGKCFSACEGRKVKLERANLEKEYLPFHDSAIEFRNNFAAHSGSKKLESAVVVIALDSKKKSPPLFSKELYQPDIVSKKDVDDFLRLFGHVKKFVEEKIDLLSDKVYSDDVLPKGEKYWYDKT